MAIIVFSQATAKHYSHARPPKGHYDPRQMMPRSKNVFFAEFSCGKKGEKEGSG